MTGPLPASNLLVSGRVLLFLPSLVAAIGLNEAIVLQQVRYYLADERQPRIWQNTRWVRASLERWQERDFPFWGQKTLQRAFDSLVKRGFLRVAQPDLSRRDATKWYTIDFAALEPIARLVERRRQERRAPTAADEGHRNTGALPPLPASHLLLDEHPLVIAVDLARLVGLDEALLLQQLRYWLADERRPLFREGQRWVCPRDVDFFAPLMHRSSATLARILSGLEQRGLLRATSRYNQQPGDRTKWYTLDLVALDRLTASTPGSGTAATPATDQIDEMSTSKPTKRPDPTQRNDHVHPASLTRSKSRLRPNPAEGTDQLQPAVMARSLKDSETDPETDPETQQHRGSAAPPVIVTIEQALLEREVTGRCARRLVVTTAADVITKQLDIYDWLRESEPTNRHVSPGRLRRMIEEDWDAPPGYRTSAERIAAAAARAREDALAVRWREARRAEVAARLAEREALLKEFALTETDQRHWVGLVASVPGIPEIFRRALLRPPAPGTAEPAVVILDDHAALDRALGTAHRATRAMIAAYLARLCQRPRLEVVYFDAPTLHARLQAPADTHEGIVNLRSSPDVSGMGRPERPERVVGGVRAARAAVTRRPARP